MRFNFLKRPVDVVPRDDFLGTADRVAALGWHIVVYFESQDLEELTPFLCKLPGTVIIDRTG